MLPAPPAADTVGPVRPGAAQRSGRLHLLDARAPQPSWMGGGGADEKQRLPVPSGLPRRCDVRRLQLLRRMVSASESPRWSSSKILPPNEFSRLPRLLIPPKDGIDGFFGWRVVADSARKPFSHGAMGSIAWTLV